MGHDLVIRGGTVVDGTGSPGSPRRCRGRRRPHRRRSVAVDDERHARDRCRRSSRHPGLRRRAHASRRAVRVGPDRVVVVLARRHLRRHRQLRGDLRAGPSGDHTYLAEMMESVEDIPARSILDGLPWDWETYGEYLSWLERTPKGVNVGGMVGHARAPVLRDGRAKPRRRGGAGRRRARAHDDAARRGADRRRARILDVADAAPPRPRRALRARHVRGGRRAPRVRRGARATRPRRHRGLTEVRRRRTGRTTRRRRARAGWRP